MEVDIAFLFAIVTKDDVRYEVRIQVRDVVAVRSRVLFDLVLERGCRLRILRAPAAPVAWVRLIAITIDVHVRQLIFLAMKIDDAGCVILAVCKSCCKPRSAPSSDTTW